jgi:hypothetical protein
MGRSWVSFCPPMERMLSGNADESVEEKQSAVRSSRVLHHGHGGCGHLESLYHGSPPVSSGHRRVGLYIGCLCSRPLSVCHHHGHYSHPLFSACHRHHPFFVCPHDSLVACPSPRPFGLCDYRVVPRLHCVCNRPIPPVDCGTCPGFQGRDAFLTSLVGESVVTLLNSKWLWGVREIGLGVPIRLKRNLVMGPTDGPP